MAKLHLPVVLCAALVLGSGLAWAGGDLESKNAPSVKTTPTEKGRASQIRVMLPTAEARLYFDDTLTKATGSERKFHSPALEDGKRYTYKVMAVWLENGREVSHEASIVFRAGEDLAVDFRR